MQDKNQTEEMVFHIPSITTGWRTFKMEINASNPRDLESVALMRQAAESRPQSMMEFLIRYNELIKSNKKNIS